MNKFTFLASALALALSAVPDAAMAKGPKGCPPGLAKKSPSCVPPGQAKKGVTAKEWRRGDRVSDDRYDVLRRGDRIIYDGDEYTIVERDGRLVLRRNDEVFRLPRLDNDRDFIRSGNQILNVSRETQQVIEIILLSDLLLG